MDCGRCYDARRDNVRCWGVRVSCSAGCRLGLGVGAFAHRVCSVVDRLRGAWRGLVARETDSAVKGVYTRSCAFYDFAFSFTTRRDATARGSPAAGSGTASAATPDTALTLGLGLVLQFIVTFTESERESQVLQRKQSKAASWRWRWCPGPCRWRSVRPGLAAD